MAQVARSLATLRIMGDTLQPDLVTSQLGCEPTRAQIKGEKSVGPKTGRVRVAKSGMWSLVAKEREPEDLDGQVRELLGMVSSDLEVWKTLNSEFEIDLFVGLFMQFSNEGMDVSPGTLKAMGDRGIMLGLDIYDPPHEVGHKDA